MKIGIVMPVYNESGKINAVLKELKRLNLSIFIVDDGSSDLTPKILKKSANENKNFRIYTHRINLGKGAALKTGCEAAFLEKVDAVIMMDSDGQHSFKDLNRFIEKLNTKSYDMVLGSRNLHHGIPLIRFLGNKFASLLIAGLFNYYVSDILCGFRAITRKTYRKLKIESTGYGVETEMIVKASKYRMRICEVNVETIYHDKHKGVTILDSIGIFFDVIRWRVIL